MYYLLVLLFTGKLWQFLIGAAIITGGKYQYFGRHSNSISQISLNNRFFFSLLLDAEVDWNVKN